MTLYLEDFSVGQVFRSEPRVVTLEEMIAFARENDPQYFHIDAEAAKASLFGGLIASGWQTAALSMRLLVEGPAPFAGGLIGMGVELSWPQPVRPGDSIRIEGEVTDIKRSRSRPDRGVVTVTTTTYNQRDEPVQKLCGASLAGSVLPAATAHRERARDLPCGRQRSHEVAEFVRRPRPESRGRLLIVGRLSRDRWDSRNWQSATLRR